MNSWHEISKEEQTLLKESHYGLLRRLLLGFIAIAILNLLCSHLFYTPKMYYIDSQNRDLLTKYNILQDKVQFLQTKVNEIHNRDLTVYRSLFSVDSVSIDGIYTPYPKSKYDSFSSDEYVSIIAPSWLKMDALARQAYAVSISMDELQKLAKNKEVMSQAIPAVWPIDRTVLKAMYSFGMRYHPIYHTRKLHTGVDLACSKGNLVYATADAVVEATDNGRRYRGYGEQILLNHSYGYKTRYAHLRKILVKEGEKVTRGQVIGQVGSTGGSTGSHLHYEVIYMGRPVNPVNYFNKDMTAEEYRSLVENINYTADLEAN